MKTLFILALSFCAITAGAQRLKESKVPEPVKAAFLKLYPNADDVSWEMENSNYEANFEAGEIESSAVFDLSGNLLFTETEMGSSENLPSNLNSYLKQNYPKNKVKEVSKIIDSKGVLTYEVEIKGKELLFDASGNFLSIQKD